MADQAYDMNVLAARLAKRIASDYATKDKPRWVAGSMGPGRKLPTLGHISFLELKAAYAEQVRGLLDGGVDLLIVETCQDLLQTKAALSAIFEHFEKNRVRVPVIAQVTIETFGTMLNGTEISAALTALAPFPIDVIGMNCGTGPRHMTESIRYLCENAPLPVSILPNAGLPSVKEGKMHYDETPETFTKQLQHFAGDFGVNIVDVEDVRAFMLLVSLAKEQEHEGAHVLDVNVDFVGRDGEADMHELASRLVTNVKIPLMFDSTEWQKMEAGLQHAGGKCILNSTNYEDGEPRFAKVLELA